jgi:hypothetical protein
VPAGMVPQWRMDTDHQLLWAGLLGEVRRPLDVNCSAAG